jgi:transmembrane sensor
MKERLQYLLERCYRQTATQAERDELLTLVAMPEHEEAVNALIESLYALHPADTMDEATGRNMLAAIFEAKDEEQKITTPVHRIHFLRTAWSRYAAAVLIIFAIGAYLWNTQKQKEKPVVAQTQDPNPVKNDVLPGSDKAILTLSNGNKIELSATGGKTIKDGSLAIQNQEGALTYGETDVVVYNTMSTPKGGQYELILPDRTHVWLNAASSITYPTAFNGKTREVTVTGECYFEVEKDRKKPFIVKTPKEDIQVLGTHFNVNAYADEASIKTSLLEGAVKVGEKILKPGQAYVNGSIIQTDVNQDVAWKNGILNFNNITLEEAMRQISRWYDVEVIYEKGIPKMKFGGEMGRDLTLGQVTKALSVMGVKFRIEGRKLIVTP